MKIKTGITTKRYNPLFIKITSGLFFFIFSFFSPAQAQAEFWILDDPGQFLILNDYEQHIRDVETEYFAPYAPVQILEKNVTLSDNFTNAVSVKFFSGHYYILTDTDNNVLPAGEIKPVYKRFIVNKTYNDTLVLNQPVKMEKEDGTEITLRESSPVIRIFSYQGLTYVQTQSVPPDFGWMNLSEVNYISAADKKTREQVYNNNMIIQRVDARINLFNNTVDRYFRHLNNIKSVHFRAPGFVNERVESGYFYRFVYQGDFSDFRDSFETLSNEVRLILTNSNLKLTIENNSLRIIPDEN